MDYLSRDAAPFSQEFWQQIDQTVVDAVKKILVGRRFLPFHGPLGSGTRLATIDAPGHSETFADGYVKTTNRLLAEVPQIYADFWLDWRDIENASGSNVPVDLSAVRMAAYDIARMEDRLIFYGNEMLGLKGLVNIEGSNSLQRRDWSKGENPFLDVAAGMALLEDKGRFGRYALVLSSDLYLQLERLQPGTGVLESTRIENYIGGRLFKSSVLEEKTAVLLCCESPYVDLLVGQDFSAAYLELVDLNHHLRILETVLPRIKAPDAIVVYR